MKLKQIINDTLNWREIMFKKSFRKTVNLYMRKEITYKMLKILAYRMELMK